jgi:DivIVA domain-containing protein
MVRRMPDQNSASTEHALIQEVTAPLATLPNDPVPEVANVDFPVVLRGYDRLAVDAYVKRVSQLVAELSATRSPQAAVRKALERVGEDVSGILQRAHDTAQQITSQSRGEAEDRLEAARREAEVIVEGSRREAEALLADAKSRLRELDTETDRIWQERHRIVEDTRQLASQLLAVAESAIERFPADEEEPTAVAGQPFDVEEDTVLLEERATFPEEGAIFAEDGTTTLHEEDRGDEAATLHEEEGAMNPDDEEATLIESGGATHLEEESMAHLDDDAAPPHEDEDAERWPEPGMGDEHNPEPDSQQTMPIEQVHPPDHGSD